MTRMVPLIALLLLAGCGFQASLAKAHEGVKAMSLEVEPPLAAHCLKKARACHRAKDTACAPLAKCRKQKAAYVRITAALHRLLAEASSFHRGLQKDGVIE